MVTTISPDLEVRIIKVWKQKTKTVSSRTKTMMLLNGLDRDDVAQEVRYALVKAIRSYDEDGAAKLNTYLWKCVKNHLGHLKAKDNRYCRYGQQFVLPIDVPLFNNDDVTLADLLPDSKADAVMMRLEIKDVIEQIYNRLDDLGQKVMVLLLQGLTTAEIYRALKIKRKEVNEILKYQIRPIARIMLAA